MIKKTLLIILSLFSFTITSANIDTNVQTGKTEQSVKTSTIKAKKITPKKKKRITKKRNRTFVEKDQLVMTEPVILNSSTKKNRTTIQEQVEMRDAAQRKNRSIKNNDLMQDNTTVHEQTEMRNAAQGKIKATMKGETNNATSNKIYQEEQNR